MTKFLLNNSFRLIIAAAAASFSVLGTPVEIRVHCDGVDFSALTLPDAATASHVLASSYAEVHEHDATSLQDVTYHGAVSLTAKAPSTPNDSSLVSNYLGKWLNFFGHHKREHKVTGQFAGTWDCATEACAAVDEASELVAWENEFVAGLLVSSSNSVYDKVKKCTIDVQPANADATIEPNVDVGIKCNKKNMLDQLSVGEGTFLGKALQDTYAKVHTSEDGADSELYKIFFHKKLDKIVKSSSWSTDSKSDFIISSDNPDDDFSHNLRWCDRLRPTSDCWYLSTKKGFYWSGDWRCTRCPGSMMEQQQELLSWMGTQADQDSPIMVAWEAELVAKLNQGPFATFHGVTECEIAMEPHTLKQDTSSLDKESMDEPKNEGEAGVRKADDDEENVEEQSIQHATVNQA